MCEGEGKGEEDGQLRMRMRMQEQEQGGDGQVVEEVRRSVQVREASLSASIRGGDEGRRREPVRRGREGWEIA